MTKITASRHSLRPPPMPRKDVANQQIQRGQLDLEQFYPQSEVKSKTMKIEMRFCIKFT